MTKVTRFTASGPASGWHPGDLGRSKLAREDRPQFEAISASKDGVTVWHHMCATHDVIPVATFKRDFTPTWKLARAVPAHEVRPGQVYTMSPDAPAMHTLRNRGTKNSVEGTNVGNVAILHIRSRNLEVRRVQHDFASCKVIETGVLVILSVELITRWGAIFTTFWQHLESDWSL